MSLNFYWFYYIFNVLNMLSKVQKYLRFDDISKKYDPVML